MPTFKRLEKHAWPLRLRLLVIKQHFVVKFNEFLTDYAVRIN